MIPKTSDSRQAAKEESEYLRISRLMNQGNEARKNAKNNAILAYGAAGEICLIRKKANSQSQSLPRTAFIVKSLKHPDEVKALREIYPQGFYLIGIYADREARKQYFTGEKGLTPSQAEKLIRRDEDEELMHGQQTRETFHLSDFFINHESDTTKIGNSIQRILEVIFGHPYNTPTFDEYAMFMAFAATLEVR